MLVKKVANHTSINSKMMKLTTILIVGLGNPGYDHTRHNVGSDILSALLNTMNKIQIEQNLYFVFFKGFAAFVLLKPDIMNISGKKIYKIFSQLQLKHLIVVTDDLDTPVGKLKKSFSVSANGHNGVRSIIEYFGTNKFWKIRVGIGRPYNQEVSDYVLELFNSEEQSLIINEMNISNLQQLLQECHEEILNNPI